MAAQWMKEGGVGEGEQVDVETKLLAVLEDSDAQRFGEPCFPLF